MRARYVNGYMEGNSRKKAQKDLKIITLLALPGTLAGK
jgi:hypothetical protein